MDHARTIRLYYAYRMTTSNGFWVPVGTLYLVNAGYGLDIVGLANAALVFTIVAAEIPAGYAGDRLGRRATLGVGTTITTTVMASYAFLDSGTAYVALFALWGVGFAFNSAIGEAWLYDLLTARADEDSFAHVNGRGETVELVTGAAASLLATWLYTIAPPLPFLANAALAAAGLPILFALPPTRNDTDDHPSITRILRVLRAQLRRPEVRWIVAYAALFNVLFSLTRWLEQPAMDAVGIPVAALGVVYAAFRLISATATSLTGRIQNRLGHRGFFALLIPVCGLAYALVAVLPLAVVPVLVLRRVLDRVSGPIRNQYINDRLSGFGRATVLSGVSMALHVASGVGNVVAGRIAAATGPVGVFPLAGVAITAVATVLWLTTTPIRSASGSRSQHTQTTTAN